MKKMAMYVSSAVLALSLSAQAQHKTQDLLIKLAPGFGELEFTGAKTEKLTDNWVRVQLPKHMSLNTLMKNPSVESVQPNYKITLPEDFSIQDPLRRAALAKMLRRNRQLREMAIQDNPGIPNAPQPTTGSDPLFPKQWGMLNIGVQEAWKVTKGSPEMIVAVIDTGVDYTHEDLLPNLWRNEKEIPNNGIDDDGNGYIDDVIGWDFASNDNKPFDLSMTPLEILFKGGNPGHGTHCAGNVAARGDNGKGIAGVAPNVKIMSLRFITEKGQGTTADAIKAIKYAVDNGAKVLSNSWGSEGEDPNEGTENKALRDAIQYAQDKGVLFIAAAGNGHKGVGYDNDSDSAPAYPASYANENIVSVAALDSRDKLGSFSNWGLRSVDIGAPGVAVFSTMVGNNYSDVVIDKFGFKATWDGTSMATPHVAGAAALYWSAHPEKTWQDVKAALLGSAKKIDALNNKTVSGGKLDVGALLKF
ncbi:MAG: S8 family peptidase [Bdellovibrio sp.]